MLGYSVIWFRHLDLFIFHWSKFKQKWKTGYIWEVIVFYKNNNKKRCNLILKPSNRHVRKEKKMENKWGRKGKRWLAGRKERTIGRRGVRETGGMGRDRGGWEKEEEKEWVPSSLSPSCLSVSLSLLPIFPPLSPPLPYFLFSFFFWIPMSCFRIRFPPSFCRKQNYQGPERRLSGQACLLCKHEDLRFDPSIHVKS